MRVVEPDYCQIFAARLTLQLKHLTPINQKTPLRAVRFRVLHDNHALNCLVAVLGHFPKERATALVGIDVESMRVNFIQIRTRDGNRQSFWPPFGQQVRQV